MKVQNCEVTWTTLELTGLLEDEDSHVQFLRAIKHLALHPYHLNNVQRGVSQILQSSLNSYDKELKGFVLAFRNPKLLSNVGETLYDSPFIHIDVEADFYLFCPTVGSSLKGIVKKKGLDHIVLLVHKIYTISIPKPDDEQEWIGESVKIDQEVKCYINYIDNKSKPPFIGATLKSDYSQGCRLSESTNNNIDNVDSAIDSMNSTIKTEILINGIPEDDGLSEKERKKHRKKHKKSRENNPELIKIENESMLNNNIEIDTSTLIKSEKKLPKYLQDSTLNTDDSLNDIDDNVPKKHKKSKKMSKSLPSDDVIVDTCFESCKSVKRENSVPLDTITEVETKKKKKYSKKFTESDLYLKEEKIVNDAENTISKSEKKEQCIFVKPVTSSTDFVSNNLEDNISKKHKKTKKRVSESESESQTIKIKIEKPDPIVDKIINQSQVSYSEVKNENNNVSDASDKKKKHSPKKHTNMLKKDTKVKNENIINTINDLSQIIKHEPEDSQCMKYNISAMDSSSNNSDLDNIKKSKKRKTSTILDTELKHPIKIKTEKNID